MEGQLSFQVFDAHGRKVRGTSGNIAEGQLQVPLSMVGLDRGSYVLQILDSYGVVNARCPFIRH